MDMAARMVTTMGIDMTATPAEQLLILQNWFSPAFPIGAFSYSSGLETAIARGAVHDRDSLTAWLTVSFSMVAPLPTRCFCARRAQARM